MNKRIWWLLSLPLLFFLLIPILALLSRTSLSAILVSLGEPEVAQAVQLSFATTLISLLLILIFGTPLAYVLMSRRTRLTKLIDTIIDLPTVLPPSVAGIALLLAFGRMGLLGSGLNALHVQIAFTQTAVVLAQMFVASPFYIKAAAIALASVDTEMKQAAALDGASPVQVFRYVTLPLAWQGLLSGAVMSWARALGEFGATILFAGNLPCQTQTMPLAIYVGFEGNLDVAITLSVILMTCAFGALLAAKVLLGSREP